MATDSAMMSQSLFVMQWISFLMICLLTAFHSYRLHLNKRKNAKNRIKESHRLWKILDLKYISFMVLIAYLLRGFIHVLFPTINLGTNYLNTPICNAILRISNTMGLLARFGIHLFVAVRCRLSSYKKQLNIWGKFGFIMLSSDLLITLSVWVYYPQIVPVHDGTSCVIQSYSLLYVFWIILNDIIISLYCVVVFVWPLRRIIAAERAARDEEVIAVTIADNEKNVNVDNSNKQKSKSTERSMEDFVKRVMFCSIVASLGIVVSCGISSISLTTNAGPYIVEIESFVACWMIVMQFRDIDPDSVKSKFWSVIITLFQWDYWCCCPCYIHKGVTDNGSNTGKKKRSNNNKANNMENEIALHDGNIESSKDMSSVKSGENLSQTERITITGTMEMESDTNLGIKVLSDKRPAGSFSGL